MSSGEEKRGVATLWPKRKALLLLTINTINKRTNKRTKTMMKIEKQRSLRSAPPTRCVAKHHELALSGPELESSDRPLKRQRLNPGEGLLSLTPKFAPLLVLGHSGRKRVMEDLECSSTDWPPFKRRRIDSSSDRSPAATHREIPRSTMSAPRYFDAVPFLPPVTAFHWDVKEELAKVARLIAIGPLFGEPSAPRIGAAEIRETVSTPDQQSDLDCDSVSLSGQTTDDLTESFQADGKLGSPRSHPSSAVVLTPGHVGIGSGDEEERRHSPVSLRKVELTADEDGRGPLKDRDRASGLQVLRRSSRLAGRLCASLEGGAGPRRSPRLALKPRVCYIGMC